MGLPRRCADLDEDSGRRSQEGKQQGRSAYKTLVLEDDTIMMCSGDYGSFFKRGFYSDVWVSKGAGYTWEKRLDAAELPQGAPSWQPRAGMQVVLINGNEGGAFFQKGLAEYSRGRVQRGNKGPG